MKKHASFRLSETARNALKLVAAKNGLSATAQIEILLRKEAEKIRDGDVESYNRFLLAQEKERRAHFDDLAQGVTEVAK